MILTKHLRKTTFEMFQNVSNVISALADLRKSITYVSLKSGCKSSATAPSDVFSPGIQMNLTLLRHLVYALLKNPPA